MSRWGLVVIFAIQCGLVLCWTAPAAAQAGPTVVIGGLEAPRGLTFGPDGLLYIAEAGTGGDEQIEWVPPFLSARVGTTGRISRIEAGRKTAVASGLQSLALGPASEMTGVNDLAFIGQTLYAIVGQMNALPAGRETGSLLVRIGPSGNVETVADLGRFERENNPDGAIPDSHPFGLTVGPDGNLYVAEAGANALLRVTPAGQTSVVAAWQDNPVPTGVAFDSTGRPHVSFLSHNPFVVGTARVERIAGGGAEVVVPELTMAVDLEFGPDGALYILEFSAERITNPLPPRYREASGRVLRVAPSGTEVVVGGLNFPTKMAFGPDGALYVVTNAAYAAPGSGEIVRLALPVAAAPAQPKPGASPTPARSDAAPVQVPRALPRTGSTAGLAGMVAPMAASGVMLLLAGLAMRRRRR